MSKILAQTGVSLADVYDIKGSIAGVEQLRSEEVQVVHEMGGTIFSERLGGQIRRLTSGAILQDTNWDIVVTTAFAHTARVFGVAVISDTNRVSFATVSLRDEAAERELPIWTWDPTAGALVGGRLDDNGGGAATVNILTIAASLQNLPSMLMGGSQRNPLDAIAFRGRTTGFGAGTVTCTALLYIGFVEEGGGLNSNGLPLPSW